MQLRDSWFVVAFFPTFFQFLFFFSFIILHRPMLMRLVYFMGVVFYFCYSSFFVSNRQLTKINCNLHAVQHDMSSRTDSFNRITNEFFLASSYVIWDLMIFIYQKLKSMNSNQFVLHFVYLLMVGVSRNKNLKNYFHFRCFVRKLFLKQIYFMSHFAFGMHTNSR